MEDRRKHIDDLFREGLSEYRETPPPAVWSALEQRLPKPEGPDRKGLWLLLLLLLAGTVGYMVFRAATDVPDVPKTATRTAAAPKDLNAQSAESASTGQQDDASITGDKSPDQPFRNTATTKSEKSNRSRANRLTSPAAQNPGNGQVTTAGKWRKDNRNLNGSEKYSDKKESGTAQNAGKTPRQNPSEVQDAARTENPEKTTTSDKGRRENRKGNAGPTSARLVKDGQNMGEKKRSATVPSAGREPSAGTVHKVNRDLSAHPTKKPKATSSTKDDSYLLQPVPDDQETDETVGTRAKEGFSGSKPDDGDNEGLHYVPKEGVSRINAGAVTAQTDEKKASQTREDVGVEGKTTQPEPINVKPAEAKATPETVAGASANNKPIPVSAATFKKNKTETDPPGTFKKSRMSVSSEVKNEGKTAVSVQGARFEGAFAADQTTNPAGTFAANSSNYQEAEQNETAQPTGGGGGGGGAKPAKKGGKFRFDLGIKAGYERGLQSLTTNTLIFAPYLQWNISSNFSFVFQPGFRYNSISSNSLQSVNNAYHQVTAASLDSAHVVSSDTFGNYIQRNYIYSNTYDSILIGRSLKTRNYWEIELPIMLRYKIASNIAMFGGISLMFGNIIQMDEDRQQYSNLTKTSNLSFPKVPYANGTQPPTPTIPSLSNYFSYNTPDISAATATSDNPATNPARMGIMFGISYELQKRITIDLLYKQTISDMRYVPNEDIRKIYTQPYLRVMVGIKLFDGSRSKKE